MPITIEGTPFSTSAVKRIAAAEAIASKLSQIDAGADSERHTDHAGDSEDQHRADDRIGHAAARLSDRLGSLRQEGPVDGTHAAIHQIAEDGNQRGQDQQDRQDRHAGHEVIGNAASPTDR